jgi:hypothetical protein
MWNEELRVLLPPWDAAFNVTAAYWTTVSFSGLTFITFMIGIMFWRRTKNPIVLLMLLGGLTTVIVEPYLDFIGGAFHPVHGQNVAFELMGRPIPWWVIPCYMFLFGGLGTLNYMAFTKGATMRQVWLWFFVPMSVDIIMEEMMMHFNLYSYYGQQPLIVFSKFPLWWSATNGMGVFLGVVIVTLMAPYLKGWKLLLIPVIMPVADGLGYAAVGLPTIIAVQTPNLPMYVSQLAGIADFALTALFVYWAALLLGTDSPLRQGTAANSPGINNLLHRPASA